MIDPRCVEAVTQAASRLNGTLGGSLVGVYVHGSAVLGDFDPGRSDVDLLAVSADRISSAERQAVGRELVSMSWPGVGLEFSLVTRGVAERPSARPPFEVHVQTTEGTSVVEGSGRAGDRDLLIHFLVLHHRGEAILGPPPSSVFADPPREGTLLAIEDDLRWALERDKLGYAVLNACRALRFIMGDLISSKLDAGEWAIEHRVAPVEVVNEAIVERKGGRAHIPREEALAFVQRARALLHREAPSPNQPR